MTRLKQLVTQLDAGVTVLVRATAKRVISTKNNGRLTTSLRHNDNLANPIPMLQRCLAVFGAKGFATHPEWVDVDSLHGVCSNFQVLVGHAQLLRKIEIYSCSRPPRLC